MILAVSLWLVLAIAPGAAILGLANVRWGFWRSLAAAPALGFGSIYILGLSASRLRVPVVGAVIAFVVVLLLAWVVVQMIRIDGYHRRVRLARHFWQWVIVRLRGRSALEYLSWSLVVGAVIFGGVVWFVIERGMDFPPGWDSMHHGYFTRQILNFQTLDSSTVLASSPDSKGSPSFYPLVFNLITAVVHTISGVPVSHVILAGISAIGALFAPVTVFALAKLIDPSRPLVAGLAALIAPFPLGTYAIIGTGRDNAVLGLAVVLGAAIALIRAPGSQWIRCVLAMLALVGITGLHTSELPIAVLVAGSVATVGAVRSREFRAFGKWLLWSAVAAFLALGVLTALEPTLLTASSARSGAMAGTLGHTPVGLGSAILNTAALGWDRSSGKPPLIQLLVIAGLVVPIFSRKLRPYLSSTIYFGIFALLMIGLFTDGLGPFTFLTAPWYQDLSRLAWTYPILGAIPGAVFLGSAFELFATILVRYRNREASTLPETRWAQLIVPAAFCLVATLALLYTGLPRANAANLQLRTYSDPAGQDSRLAFQYMQNHIRPQDVVMDDLRISGSLWMYNDYSVKPLFGNSPYLGSAPKSWKERLWLRAHFANIASDPCVNVMLKKYNVRYVYYDEAKIYDGVREITLTTLDHNAEFKPYYSAGSVSVYSVKLPAHLQQCTKDVSIGVTWD